MLRSISSKQSEESVESVWMRKGKVTVVMICEKGGFQPGIKESGVMNDESAR